jgi:hypothetical protein
VALLFTTTLPVVTEANPHIQADARQVFMNDLRFKKGIDENIN